MERNKQSGGRGRLLLQSTTRLCVAWMRQCCLFISQSQSRRPTQTGEKYISPPSGDWNQTTRNQTNQLVRYIAPIDGLFLPENPTSRPSSSSSSSSSSPSSDSSSTDRNRAISQQPMSQEGGQEYYSIIEPLGASSSSCGYCHSDAESSHSYGAWAHTLSPKVYQLLIDRGWRRSGCYLYLPDRHTTCCPPYTIRCSASQFKPTRSQRQAAYRWRKAMINPTETGASSQSKQQKNQPEFDLCRVFNFSDTPAGEPKSDDEKGHSFEIKLEPAGFSEEKFELYKKYQMEVHGDSEASVTRKSFERFLCNHPFGGEEGRVAQHACWRVDDELIAFSVLDMLPSGISSVYLVWDTRWAKHGLGRLAALREIAWIQEWKGTHLKFSHEFDWYYLGFYIHSCPKMTYKGEYSPSFLLDPSTLDWKPLDRCIPILDASQSNVTTFSPGGESEPAGQRPADFPVKILTARGAVESIASSDPRVESIVQKLGPQVVKLSLLCI